MKKKIWSSIQVEIYRFCDDIVKTSDGLGEPYGENELPLIPLYNN